MKNGEKHLSQKLLIPQQWSPTAVTQMKFQYIQKNGYKYVNRSQRRQKPMNEFQEDTDNTLNKLKHAHTHTHKVNEIKKLIQDMKIEFNID